MQQRQVGAADPLGDRLELGRVPSGQGPAAAGGGVACEPPGTGAALPLDAGDGPTLATGDAFIADEAARERLAARAHLVDMEGYALATAAAQAGVPLRIVKHVSDDAGEGAAKSWRESVAECARALARWTTQHADAVEELDTTGR
ncbi:hypothetical protein GCM10023075_24990 [Streptosporangium album]